MSGLAEVVDLEAGCRAALPALRETLSGDWLLRVSGGDTKRVNSVNPLVPGARVGELIAPVAQVYAARGLPSRFRLTPLAHEDADAVLADAGFAVIDRSITMVAPLKPRAVDPGLTFAPRADPAWLDRIAPLSGRAGDAAAVQAALLAAIPGPMALALIEEDGGVVAAGYASIGHGRAQLSDIVVAAAARGRGLGRRLVAGLLGWAHDEGCREAMLQVLETNGVARALYRSLGFADAYPYHYRVR